MRVHDDADLVEVELVDDEPASGEHAWEPVVPRPTWLRRPPPAPAWVWPTTARLAAAALATGVVVTGVVGASQVARLARVEGLSGSLAAPLVEAWSRPAGGPMGMVGGLLLTYGTDGSSVAAVDLATGAEEWSGPSPDAGQTGWCQLVADDLMVSAAALPVLVDPAAGAVVCITGAELGPDLTDAVSHVVVLEPATGDLRTALDLAGAVSSVEAADGDLLVYGVEAEGRAVLRRFTDQGAPVWQFRSEPGVAPDGYLPSYGVLEGVAVIEAASGERLAVDLGTGRATDPPERGALVWCGWPQIDLPDGGSARVVEATSGSPMTEVTGPRGEERFAVLGAVPLPASVDDGSAAGVLLVTDIASGQLRALDPRTGDARWSMPSAGWGGAVVLTGVVVVPSSQGGLRAVDALDGELRWEVPPPRGNQGWYGGGMATDGRRLLSFEAPAVGVPAASVLTARDITSGEVVWQAPGAGAMGWLTTLPDGAILAFDGGTLTLLRPAAA